MALKLSILNMAFSTTLRFNCIGIVLQRYMHFRRIIPSLTLQRHTNWHAVAFSLTSAALASFQWPQPSQPPCKNVNSAVSPLTPACHFGG
jgi:hypothetical protein